MLMLSRDSTIGVVLTKLNSGGNMNNYRVTVVPVHGEIKEHIVQGDDGPNFKDMYKLLGCNMIEITGCRVGGKNYEMYIDEEGRFKDSNGVNPTASHYFIDWLSNQGRVARVANIVGDAAVVDPEPISERK